MSLPRLAYLEFTRVAKSSCAFNFQVKSAKSILSSSITHLRLFSPALLETKVNQGTKSTFYQELVAVDPDKNAFSFLAPAQHKLVATPDLDSILSHSL